MSRKIFLHLTGGLGNQLFQLAAGLSQVEPERDVLYVDTSLGKPRSTDGIADIFSFKLPKEVHDLKLNSSNLACKTAGFLLRSGISPRGIERARLIKSLLQAIGSLILSGHFKERIKVAVSHDVGFQNLEEDNNRLLIGYFQSYRYLENLKKDFRFDYLQPIEISEELEELIKKAQAEKPIFVHLRFTDYVKEKKFGLPGITYYRNALNWLRTDNRAIWVFSDDHSRALETLPSEFQSQYVFINDSSLTPVQVLHLLRFGDGYVIANSSFSWWGASLRADRTSKVVAPEPWFAGMPEPMDLIPVDWHREKAHFD